MKKYIALLLLFWLVLGQNVIAQTALPFLEPDSIFNKKRFYTASSATLVSYSAAVVALDRVWYSQYPRSGFHFFNDIDEWQQMDKVGHAVAAYQYARVAHTMLDWSGVKPKTANWSAFGISMVLQGTIEMLDAYSTEWGFSAYDLGFNTAGGLGFFLQQQAWGEQRVLLKISGQRPNYPNTKITSTDSLATMTLRERATDIYGTNPAEVLLKDYNNVSYWASISPKMFLPHSKWPVWLNVAVGYSAENLYSGQNNTWTGPAGNSFVLPASYAPYRQWVLSPDIYFSKIPTRSRALKVVFGALDIFKLPAPALVFAPGKGLQFDAFQF